MYQLTFSEQAMCELKRMESETQIHFIDQLSNLVKDDIAMQSCKNFERDGKTYIRNKLGDFRIYMERLTDGIVQCSFILPQHSLTDFVFRSKLPVSDEQILENHSSFWKYLESLKK